MPADRDSSSASDTASSNFYSSSEKDGDTRIAILRESDTDSVEELDMPTEDDEDNPSGAIGLASSNGLTTERPGSVTSSNLRGVGSVPWSGHRPFADNEMNEASSGEPERKRKREFDRGVAAGPTHPQVGAVTTEQYYGRANDPFQVRPGSTNSRHFEADLSFAGGSGRKRAKVSPQQDTTAGKGLFVPMQEIGSMPSPQKSQFPIEIWQHIFTFVPPVSLGRLLRVNRSFNACLTESSKAHLATNSVRQGVVQLAEADTIWSASRKLFCPGLPRPPRDLKELDMWRLIRGRDCQFCGKLGNSKARLDPTDPWEAGPGKDGVRVIWAFGARCCGTCLQDKSEKEMDLLFSSTIPSFLLPALSFIFLTPSLHVVSSIALRNSSVASSVEMKKHYYKSQVELLKQRFEKVKVMGPATAEEWVKGLEQEGKDRMSDAARWEQWESKGGLRKVNFRPAPKGSASQALPMTSTTSISSPVANVVGNDVGSDHSTPGSANNNIEGPGNSFSPAPTVHTTVTPMPNRGYSIAPPPRFSVSPLHNGFGFHQQNILQQPQLKRNIQDVNEAKANRRAEIERRCMEFDPPLLPNVLNHMESFQAAIQISTPLTDSAWEVLKPRLLAQRIIAERREHDRIMRNQDLLLKSEERRQHDVHSKETKEALEREWDDIQAPIRDRLALYADEIIRERWSEGGAVSKDASPRFAADVLLYVRERFYADIAQENAAARSAGHPVPYDHPDKPPNRKLILENMKWVFDTKIKPLTEHFQKELFLCNGCDSNFKFYGFEGVIQHYAAKHTSTLSMGSVVVHWRAEWPEHPPFHPNPSAAKTAFYAVPTPVPGLVQGHGSVPPPALQPPNGYGGYGQPMEHGPQITQRPPAYSQFSPGPYAHSAYPGLFPPNRIGPFAPPPPQGPQGYGPGFQPTSPNFQPGLPNRAGFHDAQIGYSGPSNGYEGYSGQYQGQMPQMYDSPFPGPAYLPMNQVADSMVPQGYGPTQAPYGPSVPSALAYPAHHNHQQSINAWPLEGLHNTPAGQPTDLYQVQMDEMARIAREIWNGTSSIKDLPSSVRVYVIVFHVVLRFQAKFTNEPSLAMFGDGLAKSGLMKPIRNLTGLACKTCVTSGNGPGVAFHSHPHPPMGDRKLYALPSLLGHFKSVHIERAKSTLNLTTGNVAPRLDWKVDMVELPERSLIAGLVHAPGMDDTKLHLIASAFPEVFPPPLPKLGPGGNTGPTPKIKEEPKAVEEANSFIRDPLLKSDGDSPYRPLSRVTNSLQQPPGGAANPVRGQSKAPYPSSIDRPASRNPKASEPPEEGEYDPHRPAYLEHIPKHSARPQPRRKEVVQVLAKEDHDRYRQPLEALRYRDDGRRSQQDDDSRTSRPILVRYLGSEERYLPRSHHEIETPGPSPFRHGPLTHPLEIKGEIISAHTPDNVVPARSDERGEPGPPLAEAEQGSEDGEIGEAPAAAPPRTRSISPAEEVTAAERFLNDFLPGQGLKEDKAKPVEVDARKAGKVEQKRHGDHKSEHLRRRLLDEEFETQSWRGDAAPGETGENSVRVTPLHYGQPPPRGGHVRSPQSRLVNHIQYVDYDQSPAPRGQLVERSPELIDPRYVRNTVVYRDSRHAMNDQGRRPRSRYTRYEAQRHEPYPTTSRSSQTRENAPTEVAYYRTRSPTGPPRQESIYPTYSPPLPHDHASVKEQVTYTRIPSQGQVRYLDDDRAYRVPYGETLEYVPVRVSARGPPRQEPYILHGPVEDDPNTGYVRYEREYHGEPLYEHNGQLYRADPRPYDGQDPRTSQSRQVR